MLSSPIPSAATARAKSAGAGSMCGRLLAGSEMPSTSKNAAPGMCASANSARASRLAVGEDRDDRAARPELLRKPDGTGDVDPGRAAEIEPFLDQQVEHQGDRLAVGDLEGRV